MRLEREASCPALACPARVLVLSAAFSLAVDAFRLKPGCLCIGPSIHSQARVDRSVRDAREAKLRNNYFAEFFLSFIFDIFPKMLYITGEVSFVKAVRQLEPFTPDERKTSFLSANKAGTNSTCRYAILVQYFILILPFTPPLRRTRLQIPVRPRQWLRSLRASRPDKGL